mmetsp:Transcript_73050/g.152556  ORF Transcript_73050/g.152556 Transcript_73050/m.152556 type:complete len:310 (+) Transcript_73050:3062-3991(+)
MQPYPPSPRQSSVRPALAPRLTPRFRGGNTGRRETSIPGWVQSLLHRNAPEGRASPPLSSRRQGRTTQVEQHTPPCQPRHQHTNTLQDTRPPLDSMNAQDSSSPHHTRMLLHPHSPPRSSARSHTAALLKLSPQHGIPNPELLRKAAYLPARPHNTTPVGIHLPALLTMQLHKIARVHTRTAAVDSGNQDSMPQPDIQCPLPGLMNLPHSTCPPPQCMAPARLSRQGSKIRSRIAIRPQRVSQPGRTCPVGTCSPPCPPALRRKSYRVGTHRLTVRCFPPDSTSLGCCCTLPCRSSHPSTNTLQDTPSR